MNVLDILVLPSILPDSFPTVILEAMAAAKPVVATAHGGAIEMIVEGETGFLVPWDNAEAAAKPISELVENNVMRKEMGEIGRSRVLDKFSPEAFQRNFIRLFENG